MLAAVQNDPQTASAPDRVPLVVDVDGTLLRTDSLIESIFVLARINALYLFRLPLWLMKGRAHLKQRLAALATPDVKWLPYRADLLEFLRAQKRLGRKLVLATAADDKVAQKINL
jgi:phosphoserine phosphatase